MPEIRIKRRVAQDIDPWGRVRHVLATNVEQDLYHYFVTQYDITNWNYSYIYSVHTIGNQYIYGIKTFGEFPVTPYDFPVYTYQVANKGYVDSTSRLYVTFENLNDNGDVGTNSNQVAFGDHTHVGGGVHSHDNLPTDDQKDAMDSSENPTGINPFVTDSALSSALIRSKVEVLTIAIKNVIPDLAFTPIANTLIVFPVGSVGTEAVDWSLSTKTIIWDEITAGYDLEVGDIVIVRYNYNDIEVLNTSRLNVQNIRRVTSSPYTITSDDDVIFVDTDGGDITLNLPTGVNGVRYRIVNTGSSGNEIILVPDGFELLIGINSSVTIRDTESIIINFEIIEGWY